MWYNIDDTSKGEAMNKSIIEDSSSEKAVKLSGLLEEEAALKINKETDLPTLNCLRDIYFQSDKEPLRRLVEARIRALGGIY